MNGPGTPGPLAGRPHRRPCDARMGRPPAPGVVGDHGRGALRGRRGCRNQADPRTRLLEEIRSERLTGPSGAQLRWLGLVGTGGQVSPPMEGSTPSPVRPDAVPDPRRRTTTALSAPSTTRPTKHLTHFLALCSPYVTCRGPPPGGVARRGRSTGRVPAVRATPGAAGRGRGSRPPAGGAYSDGQTVSVSTGPNSFFHPCSRVVILECADPESDEAPTPLGHGIGATPSAGVASVLPVCACTLRRPWPLQDVSFTSVSAIRGQLTAARSAWSRSSTGISPDSMMGNPHGSSRMHSGSSSAQTPWPSQAIGSITVSYTHLTLPTK